MLKFSINIYYIISQLECKIKRDKRQLSTLCINTRFRVRNTRSRVRQSSLQCECRYNFPLTSLERMFSYATVLYSLTREIYIFSI